jgi:transcriptional regulator with XRE-family HTH domain
MSTAETEYLNIQVGKRIEQRRKVLGLSQSALGAASKVTFQQIHKYETGETRIPLDKLYLICKTLDFSVEDLFRDITRVGAPDGGVKAGSTTKGKLLDEDQTQKMLRHYLDIEDEKTRGALASLIKDISRISKRDVKKMLP